MHEHDSATFADNEISAKRVVKISQNVNVRPIWNEKKGNFRAIDRTRIGQINFRSAGPFTRQLFAKLSFAHPSRALK